MKNPIFWPAGYQWMHEFALALPGAELEYKPTWEALLYRLHGKIFLLLLQNRQNGKLANLKCDPYVSLALQQEYPAILPGWHMNKLHWISLVLNGKTPRDVCEQLVLNSYGLVREGLPRNVSGQLKVPPTLV